jgi:hypothetical protein
LELAQVEIVEIFLPEFSSSVRFWEVGSIDKALVNELSSLAHGNRDTMKGYFYG